MGCKSPLYLIWKEVILTTLKVLAESKVWEGDRTAERSWSANLRANVQKLHIKAEPQGESAQHDEAHPDHWGRVNGCSFSYTKEKIKQLQVIE